MPIIDDKISHTVGYAAAAAALNHADGTTLLVNFYFACESITKVRSVMTDDLDSCTLSITESDLGPH